MASVALSMSVIISPTPRPPACDHSADSAASACGAKAPRPTRSRICAASRWRLPGELAERRELRRRGDADRLGDQRQRLLGEAAGREHARHAQRPLGLAAQLAARSADRQLGSAAAANSGDWCSTRA